MKLTPILAASTLVLAGCSTVSDDPTTAPLTTPSTAVESTPSPLVSQPSPAEQWPASVDKKLLKADQSDPDAVGLAWVTLATSYDTRTDTNPADAMRRAAPYLSPALAEHFTDDTHVRTDPEWSKAAAHDAYLDVTVERIDLNPPADTDTTMYRDYEITRTWIGEDGYEQPLDPIYTSIRLSQTPSGKWQISDIA